MAGRCVQAVLDVLEKRFESSAAEIPYIVNGEVFGKSNSEKI